MERIAIFPGSFDPFTIGHKNIVDRALPLFDRIIIAIGVNSAKQPWMPLPERIDAIHFVFADEPQVEVDSFSGLAVDYARERNARFRLRGVRTCADFEYERNMADANRMLPAGKDIETILLPALPEYAAVSSSLVRELARFGAPYAHLLPYTNHHPYTNLIT